MAADQKLFKRLFDILLRHTDMRMTEAERTATAGALAKAWTSLKNAYRADQNTQAGPANGTEAENQQAFHDFMQWIADQHASYSREELRSMLDMAAATLDTDHPDFRAAMQAHAAAQAQAEQAAADPPLRSAIEEQLLEIAKLLRKARLMQQSSAAAALFSQAAETARERYGFSKLQVDQYYLERERAILEMYQNNELRMSLGRGLLAEEYEARIYAVAEKYGLMDYRQRPGDGVPVLEAIFSDEFEEGWTLYLADRDAEAAFVDELAREFAAAASAANYAPRAASQPGQAGSAPGAAPPAPPAAAHVVVYPVRDFYGTLQSHLGATNYDATLQRVVDSSPDTSLMLEFPADGIRVLDKTTIKIRQFTPAHDWRLTGKEITWHASHDAGSAAHLVDASFVADTAQIILNAADRVDMQIAETGRVELRGLALKTKVELQKAGSLEIHDRFESSVYSSGESGGIRFVGEKARAIASAFIGNAPSIDDIARRTVEKAFTADRALSVFDAIAHNFVAGLGLRIPGTFQQQVSHSFTPAVQVPLRPAEMALMDYLLHTLQDGVKSAGLALFQSPKPKIQSGRVTIAALGAIFGNAVPPPLTIAEQVQNWQVFSQQGQASVKDKHALAVPLLLDSDDFQRWPDAGDIRQMGYRIFFFAGTAEAYRMLNGDATIRETLGRSPAFFATLHRKLDTDDVKACYVDVMVQRSAASNHTSHPRPATLGHLQRLYGTLRRTDLSDPFGQARRVPWSTVLPRSGTEIGFIAQEPDKSKLLIDDFTPLQKETWTKSVAQLRSAIPAEDKSLTLLHGRFFQGCVFRGTYRKVLFEEFQNNRFEQFTGEELQFETTLNGCALADAKLTGIGRSSMTLDALKAGGNSVLEIVSGDTHDMEGRGLTVEDSTLFFGGPRRTTLHAGRYQNARLEFSDITLVGLLGGSFEKCSLIFSNVPVVDLAGSRFHGCTLTLNAGKSKQSTSVCLSRVGAEATVFAIGQLEQGLTADQAMLIDCTLDVCSPVAMFGMTRLLGGCRVKGKIDQIDLQHAQLGSPVGGPQGMLEWNVASSTAQVTDMNVGTVMFMDAASLGRPEAAQWRTVTVNGEPSMLPGVSHIYAMLGLAKNFEAERPSTATDERATPAKGFTL